MTNHYLVRIKGSTGYTVHEEKADSLSAAVTVADDDGVSDCHLLVQTYYISDPY